MITQFCTYLKKKKSWSPEISLKTPTSFHQPFGHLLALKEWPQPKTSNCHDPYTFPSPVLDSYQFSHWFFISIQLSNKVYQSPVTLHYFHTFFPVPAHLPFFPPVQVLRFLLLILFSSAVWIQRHSYNYLFLNPLLNNHIHRKGTCTVFNFKWT